MQTNFPNYFHNLDLQRFPKSKSLQAWDAADEYLLNHLSANKKNLKNCKCLIFNDSFGALSLALHSFKPTCVTDSIITEQAIKKNCIDNNINPIQIEIKNSMLAHTGQYDYLLIKIPKNLNYLRYFLTKIRPHINDNTQVIVACMIKTTAKTVWDIFEQMLGSTSTSLAKKKARLIFVNIEKNETASPFPTYFNQENTGMKIYNHANVFSMKSMDIGTRFLLQNLPKFESIGNIIDLGCGNGIVGVNLAILYPHAQIVFTDESYMAVASAKLTAENNLSVISNHQFVVANCLDGFDNNIVDLIVCNPPFHQSHSVGLYIALQMFQQSFKTLNCGGKFIVVANRHLPYYSHLKRIFGDVENIAGNNKFSIYGMTKSSQ